MADGKYQDLLKSTGFQSFLWTQFLGSFNDNVFKMIVSMFAVDRAGAAGGGSELSLVGALFILPFFLFSGYAGHLADTFSKRVVLISVKVFEVVAMAAGILAFLAGRMDMMLGVVVMMAL